MAFAGDEVVEARKRLMLETRPAKQVLEWVMKNCFPDDVAGVIRPRMREVEVGPSDLAHLREIVCGDSANCSARCQRPGTVGQGQQRRGRRQFSYEQIEDKLNTFKEDLPPLIVADDLGWLAGAIDNATSPPTSIDDLVDSCLYKHYAAEQQARVAGLGASVLLGRDLTRAKVLLSGPDREKWGKWLLDLEPRGIKISPRTADKKLKLWKHYGLYPRLWQVRAKQSELIKLGPQINKYLETHPQEALFWKTTSSELSPSSSSSSTTVATNTVFA